MRHPELESVSFQDNAWQLPPHVLVIAEIGINHNGDLRLAKQMIDAAAAAGCDAVKFQKRAIDRVYTQEYLDSPRQSPWGTTQREQKEGLEFDTAQYAEIDRHCRDRGIDWFASAWDLESQAMLARFDLRWNKIASPMLTHEPLLEAVAAEGKPTFVSTGMTEAGDIRRAVNIFLTARCPITLMHCVSEYPTADESVHLRSMQELHGRFGLPVGYSGHERGILPSVLAAAWGAVVIERHFTLDRELYGSDQKASIQPSEMAELVHSVRSIPGILGKGERQVSADERANARKLRYWDVPTAAVAVER